jgi:thioredoxin reductase (NADPH)
MWTVPRPCWRPAGPGVFAVGDVRTGSIKRIAATVGKGLMAVQLVHEHLPGQRAQANASST